MISRALPFAALFFLPPALSQAGKGIMLDPQVREKCVEILRDGMNSDEFWPAMHAAEGLTYVGLGPEVIRFLGPKLDAEKDDQRRCGLARELARAGDDSKRALMMQILESDDSHGHVHAAESLYKVGWIDEREPLENAFRETDDIRLKLMAAAAIARWEKDDMASHAYSFLRNNLENEPAPDIFRLTAWVLGRIGNANDIPLIRSRLKDADDPIQRAFLEHALAALGDPEGKAALLRNLKSSDATIRTYAAVFAGETETTEAYTDLVSLLDSEILDLRIRAAHALLSLSIRF